MQLTDEPDKRCYPLDEHLYCHMCHIKRLHLEFPEEQFYIDPYTFHILNKTTGNQRDSIAIMPASISAYPSSSAHQELSSLSNGQTHAYPNNSTFQVMGSNLNGGQIYSYLNNSANQIIGSQSNVSGGKMAPPPPPTSCDAPPPVPPHRKIVMNGYDGSSPYNKPMPQVPPGGHGGIKKTITDL